MRRKKKKKPEVTVDSQGRVSIVEIPSHLRRGYQPRPIPEGFIPVPPKGVSAIVPVEAPEEEDDPDDSPSSPA